MSGKTYYIDNNGLRHLIKKKVHIDANGVPTQIKKKFFEGKNTFSSSHIVKYHVDVNDVRDVEVDDGSDAILWAPTPVRSGWIFAGWREDEEADPTVLDHKTVEVDGLHLYAVFKKNITVTLQGGSSAIVNTGVRYHNNSNDESPVITLGASAITGWNLVGYRNDMTATSAVDYTAGQSYTFDESKTIYAVFSRTLTLSYNGNGATGGSTAAQTGTQYYNNGYYGNPSITLRANGFVKGYTYSNGVEYSNAFNGWNLGAAGATISISDNTTALAQWKATATGRTFIVKDNIVQPSFVATGTSGTTWGAGSTMSIAGWHYNTNRHIGFNVIPYSSYSGKTLYIDLTMSTVNSDMDWSKNPADVCLVNTYSTPMWTTHERGGFTRHLWENGRSTVAIPCSDMVPKSDQYGNLQWLGFTVAGFNNGGYRNMTIHNMWVQ